MLKKAVLWLILGVFCTPLFLQTWQGHAFGHALHEIYQPPAHDQTHQHDAHDHDHHAHRHDDLSFVPTTSHHLLPDAVFYFSDFLNLDLHLTAAPKKQAFFKLQQGTFTDQLVSDWQPGPFQPKLLRYTYSAQAQAPPLSEQSIYLKTQRLRL